MNLEWRSRLLDRFMIASGMKVDPPGDDALEKYRATVDGFPTWTIHFMFGKPRDLSRIEDLTIPVRDGSIGGRLYVPLKQGPLPCIVFYHGGGWVSGDLDTHDTLCREIAYRTARAVLAVDYRLAPEHRFPTAAEDAFDALSWFADHASEYGADAGDLAVMGDSAGGNLSAVVCQMARDEGGPKIQKQVLVYPYVDASREYASANKFAHAPILTKSSTECMVSYYIRSDADRGDARFSALLGNLDGLPPALIIAAECDPIADHAKVYADALEQHGVPVQYRLFERQIHGFFSIPGIAPRAKEAYAMVERFLSAP